jgi:hypothetical protein
MLIGGLPEQELIGICAPEEYHLPENRLMLAVLQEALSTFQRGIRSRVAKDIEAFREVDRWFRSREFDWPFSFECICSTLEIDPGCVREGLNRLRRQAFQHRAAIRTVRAPYRSSYRPGLDPSPSPLPRPSRSMDRRIASAGLPNRR